MKENQARGVEFVLKEIESLRCTGNKDLRGSRIHNTR
jgi:hypothetical protein